MDYVVIRSEPGMTSLEVISPGFRLRILNPAPVLYDRPTFSFQVLALDNNPLLDVDDDLVHCNSNSNASL
eukprot:2439743-Rhodomonas_salina.2